MSIASGTTRRVQINKLQFVMGSPQGPSGPTDQVAIGPATGRHPRDLALCQRDLGPSKA